MDESNTIDLPDFGDATGWCTTLRLKSNDEYLKTLEIGYDTKGITHMAFASTDQIIMFGE